ncbi:DNA repair RAD52-like protein 1, mitochondrial isoform X2 [Magnolia sinica]|uniref:DNA repair RAD52-like protein 1, mitochondrial isoform X2 n=1 Tax=Magnolia sinica TaxID=86752 RepID=UPI002659177A|nr:DNA repair RAD52-like protein 1, mitochondrial isoform X2 [Magnolia sinica]
MELLCEISSNHLVPSVLQSHSSARSAFGVNCGFLTIQIRHIVNRIMNLHAPEWSGEIRSITYSADGKSVSVVYRVTLYGTDAEIYRESSGTASVDDTGYADPVQKAEAMAFRRACARLGLGLHLYHEDMM